MSFDPHAAGGRGTPCPDKSRGDVAHTRRRNCSRLGERRSRRGCRSGWNAPMLGHCRHRPTERPQLRDPTALPLQMQESVRQMHHDIGSPKSYRDRAANCQRLADAATDVETRDTMTYLAEL